MELRYGFEETTLTYSNLDLWNEFKEEKDLIKEREKEEEEDGEEEEVPKVP